MKASTMHFRRRIRGALQLVLVAALCSSPALAQWSEHASRPQLTVEPIDTIQVARGGTAPLTIAMRVAPGFHINSHQPNQDYLLPTIVHLDPPEGIMIVNIAYPEAEERAMPFANGEKLSVYAGGFVVTADVRVSKTAPYGRLRVHGKVRYQACDQLQCFPPRTEPLQFDVRIVRRKAHRR